MYSARRNTNLYVISLAISACSLAIGAFALYSAGAGSRDLAVPAARAPITMRAASPWAPVSMSRDMASRARIGGVDIPNRKRVETALTSIYGIGQATASSILHETGVENKRTYELDEDELSKIRAEVDKYTIEGDLRRQVRQDIARLIDIQCFRGKRHQAGLPCRGQNTKNNARTRKKNRHIKI